MLAARASTTKAKATNTQTCAPTAIAAAEIAADVAAAGVVVGVVVGVAVVVVVVVVVDDVAVADVVRLVIADVDQLAESACVA